MSKYNYDDFSSKEYNFGKFEGPKIGEKAPDFELATPDGKSANLLDFARDFLVLELGSVTCPLFQGRRSGMEALIEQFGSKVSFVVLYVREAHPGNNISAHKTFEEKISCANNLINDGELRKVVIDNIEGTVHFAYGGYPNAVYIINKNGCIVFRSDWNNVRATQKAINKLLSGKPARVKSYFFPVKHSVVIKVLNDSGDGVLKDFLVNLPKLIWSNLIKRNIRLFFNFKKGVAPDASC